MLMEAFYPTEMIVHVANSELAAYGSRQWRKSIRISKCHWSTQGWLLKSRSPLGFQLGALLSGCLIIQCQWLPQSEALCSHRIILIIRDMRHHWVVSECPLRQHYSNASINSWFLAKKNFWYENKPLIWIVKVSISFCWWNRFTTPNLF